MGSESLPPSDRLSLLESEWEQAKNSHLTPLERISILEAEWAQSKVDLKEIKFKLDELLHLKSKGLGAIWLIGILIGSGLIGIFNSITSIINKPHP